MPKLPHGSGSAALPLANAVVWFLAVVRSCSASQWSRNYGETRACSNWREVGHRFLACVRGAAFMDQISSTNGGRTPTRQRATYLCEGMLVGCGSPVTRRSLCCLHQRRQPVGD